MIRLSILWLAVFGVAIYTWKDWYRGLCGLVLLIGILEYPDVPKTMFGITGLNFFNLLLLNVLVAWFANRRKEQLTWDMPPTVTLLLAAYASVMVVGFIRLIQHPGFMADSSSAIVAEYFFNTLKWLIPGALLFLGCRSRERLLLGTFAFLGALVFLGLMTIKVMPLGAVLLSGDELQRLALKLTKSRIGYHRVTLSMMLAGAVWALICVRPLLADRRLRNGALIVSAVMLYAQLLTGGRAGIFTAGLIALTFGVVKWRKILLLAPVAAVIVALFMPAVVERMLVGFSTGANASTTVDQYEATAGRLIAWPLVIEKIKRSPAVGWGRQAMMSSGIAAYLYIFLQEEFGHPHNAYLEWLFDNGVVGFIPLALLLLVILFHGFRLFLVSRSALFVAAGGVSCSMVLALMFSGATGASFYPVEGTVEMWCGIFLMFRLSVERKRALAAFRQTAQWTGVTLLGAVGPRKPTPAELDALIWPGDRSADRPVTTPPMEPAFRPRTTAAPATPGFATGPSSPLHEAWQFRRAPAADAPRKRFQIFVERA